MKTEEVKLEIRKKVVQRILSLKKDIANLQTELDSCISFLKDDCSHYDGDRPSVIETMVTRYGEGDNDVWTHPQRFCTLCGCTEEGWHNRETSKIPEGQRVSLQEFNIMCAKARKDMYK
jgi:hypothetical protein